MPSPIPCRKLWWIPAAGLFLAAGCQSAWVQASITNHTDTPVNLVEVNYPGGSFGIQTIAPGATFRYRFHLLGTDKVDIDFNDAAHHDHKSKGPELALGQEGSLVIGIEPGDKVTWTPALTMRR